MLATGILGLRVQHPGAAGFITVTFSQMETLLDNGCCCIMVIQQYEGMAQSHISIHLLCRLVGEGQCTLVISNGFLVGILLDRLVSCFMQVNDGLFFSPGQFQVLGNQASVFPDPFAAIINQPIRHQTVINAPQPL